MASNTCMVSEHHLQCSLCQCLLTQPVCIPCGHSFCQTCITDHWDSSLKWTCPCCHETFSSRPKLRVNVLLSKLTNRIRSSGVENVVQICEEPITAEPHSTTNGFVTGRMVLLLLCLLAVAIGYVAHGCLETAPAELQEARGQRTFPQRQEVGRTSKEKNSFEQNIQISVNNLDKKLDNLSNKVSALMTNMVETRMTLAKLEELYRREATPVRKIKPFQQYTVDVTLDPETAHPNLVLSSDGKQVWHGHTQQNATDHSKRFDHCISVLGKQGFNSGRFYYEVNVKGKTNWDLGVVQESINRKGRIILNPTNGYWTIWLRNGDEYAALDKTVVSISLNDRLETVGVFVDYEEGLVSFYDGDSGTHIYAFPGVSFTETLYPYFSPGLNLEGKNSAPITISTLVH